MRALDQVRLERQARRLREIAEEIRPLAPLEAVRLEGVASALDLRIARLIRLTEIGVRA